MSENIENTQVKVEEKTETKQPNIKELVDSEVSKAISNIKVNLDNAYKERDDALAQVEKTKADKQKA